MKRKQKKKIKKTFTAVICVLACLFMLLTTIGILVR